MAKKKKEMTVSDIIKRRKYNLAVNAEYRSLLIRIILIVFIGWLLFSQVFLLMRNTGMDMFPSLKDGDLVLAYRLQRDYEKDDVVVYTINDELAVGRIAAKEQDLVILDENGTLTVNGTAQSGEIMYPTYAKEGITYPYRVPEGCVFILGDYRTQAEDSRDFGPVSVENVEGKVITILRRRGI